jgi:thiosulfate/3-mercaptopyruvate sulfurtransferase
VTRSATSLAVLVIALAAAPVAAQCGPGAYARAKPKPVAGSLLVSAGWLARHLADADLTILHVDRNRASYDSAHVPGARLVLTKDFTIDRDSLFTELPPVDQLERLLRSHGLGDHGKIVLYGDLLATTRLWFTLDYLGLGHRAAILDGGLPAWSAAGGAASTAAPASREPGRVTVRIDRDAIATVDYVRGRLDDPEVAVVDVRAPGEYRGEVEEKGVPRRGHISGSVNLEWVELIDEGVFKSPVVLRKLLADAGVPAGAEVIPVCRVGSRASLLYFVARYLGLRTRLYDGSMNEWSSRTDLPVLKGPAPR